MQMTETAAVIPLGEFSPQDAKRLMLALANVDDGNASEGDHMILTRCLIVHGHGYRPQHDPVLLTVL